MPISLGDQAPHSVVLRELVYALLGYTGDVFVTSAGVHDIIEISSDLAWIPEPDRCSLGPHTAFRRDPFSFLMEPPVSPRHRILMTRLVQLGGCLKTLEAFVARMGAVGARMGAASASPLGGQPGPRPPSQYQRAVAAGVEEVLKVYRSAVLELDRMVQVGSSSLPDLPDPVSLALTSRLSPPAGRPTRTHPSAGCSTACPSSL